MVKFIKDFFKEKFTNLATIAFRWEDSAGNPLETIYATFKLGNKGTRDIEFTEYKYDILNHPFYSGICIHYIKKTMGFAVEGESLVQLMKMVELTYYQKEIEGIDKNGSLCLDQAQTILDLITAEETIKLNTEENKETEQGKVIELFPKNTDGNNN